MLNPLVLGNNFGAIRESIGAKQNEFKELRVSNIKSGLSGSLGFLFEISKNFYSQKSYANS